MAFTDETAEIGSDRIHYRHGGRIGAGVPLVLVHGLAGATTFWDKNLEPLGRDFDVYALDLPGFGKSRTGQPFDAEHEVTALMDWMAHVGLSRAILVCHSLGSYLAVKLALRAPERVVGLVLAAPAIFPPGYGTFRLVLGLVPAPLHISLGFWPTLLRGAADAGASTILSVVRTLLERPIGEEELRSVRAPILLILGSGDTVIPSWVGMRLKGILGAEGPVWLPGGHVVMWDDPEGFDDAVAKFAARHGAGSS